MATTIALFSVIMNQSKKFDSLKDEITNLRIETSQNFSKLETRIERLEFKFDSIENKYTKLEAEQTNMNQKIDKLAEEQIINSTKMDNMKENNTENKNLINKVLDALTPKVAL